MANSLHLSVNNEKVAISLVLNNSKLKTFKYSIGLPKKIIRVLAWTVGHGSVLGLLLLFSLFLFIHSANIYYRYLIKSLVYLSIYILYILYI